MGKRKRGGQNTSKVVKVAEPEQEIPAVRNSDEPPPKRKKWINKQRVLVFGSRGITHRSRHLMLNMRALLPHSKAESKMSKKDSVEVINEIAEMKNCNKCIYFEQRKQMDLYMWVSNVPNGPSAKFLVENVHTMEELKMTGNCLKGSRALLSFDSNFDTPQYSLMKELFVQIFGTPSYHPKSQPFIDHVFTFSVLDNRIWFRNYQIVEENGSLAEIGPRFVLNPMHMFKGSFGGSAIWANDKFISPNKHRRALKQQAASKFVDRQESKLSYKKRAVRNAYVTDPLDSVFASESKSVEPTNQNSDLQKRIMKAKLNAERNKHKKMKRNAKFSNR